MRHRHPARWLAPLAACVVLMGAATASAQTTTTAGTGALAGTLTYNNGTGIAVPPHPCVSGNNWTLSAQSQTIGGQGGAVVLELTNNEFVGVISLSATGTATICSDLTDEFGSFSSVNFDGSNGINGGTLNCDSAPAPGGTHYGALTGSYIRAALHLHIALTGECSINGNLGVAVHIAIESELEPAGALSPNQLLTNFADSGTFAVAGN